MGEKQNNTAFGAFLDSYTRGNLESHSDEIKFHSDKVSSYLIKLDGGQVILKSITTEDIYAFTENVIEEIDKIIMKKPHLDEDKDVLFDIKKLMYNYLIICKLVKNSTIIERAVDASKRISDKYNIL